MLRLPYITTLALGVASVQAAIVEHWWNITYLDANPNGVRLVKMAR